MQGLITSFPKFALYIHFLSKYILYSYLYPPASSQSHKPSILPDFLSELAPRGLPDAMVGQTAETNAWKKNITRECVTASNRQWHEPLLMGYCTALQEFREHIEGRFLSPNSQAAASSS